MPNDISYQEIVIRLQTIVADVLRKRPDQIAPDARFFIELGAESLDLLDVRFRLERAFGFKIQQDEITKRISAELLAKEIREKLTVAALAHFVHERLHQTSVGS